MSLIFVINPGSTSTKTGLFLDDQCLGEQAIRHTDSELQQAGGLDGQLAIRLQAADRLLSSDLDRLGFQRQELSACVGRGGLVHPVSSGTYTVNQAMLDDLSACRYGEHASNLGARLAAGLAWPDGKPAYIVDPPAVDEMIDLARYTGLPSIRRRSAFHALNQKAVARRAAAALHRPYASLNFIIAHLGGGISIAAHEKGRVIDVNDALEEGPFSPDRAGSLPTLQLVRLMAEQGYDVAAMKRILVGQGGLYAYTGTTDGQWVEEQAAVRPDWHELLQAMAYQVAKSISAMAACLCGQVDAVILTGGLARSLILAEEVRRRVRYLGPILEYPGEFELQALAEGVLRVLRGQEEACWYEKEE